MKEIQRGKKSRGRNKERGEKGRDYEAKREREKERWWGGEIGERFQNYNIKTWREIWFKVLQYVPFAGQKNSTGIWKIILI